VWPFAPIIDGGTAFRREVSHRRSRRRISHRGRTFLLPIEEGRRTVDAAQDGQFPGPAATTEHPTIPGGPHLAGQLLYYLVTDASFDTGSYQQFATGYWLRRDAMRWFWDQYITDPAQREEITASPLRANTDQLRGLPPALVIVGEADVLRDEGEAYAATLRQAGVQVTAVATWAPSTTSSCCTP
jgi:hypothetical protein